MTTTKPGPTCTPRGFGIDPRIGAAAQRAPAASKEDSCPQAILKVHRPSNLNYRARHRLPISLGLKHTVNYQIVINYLRLCIRTDRLKLNRQRYAMNICVRKAFMLFHSALHAFSSVYTVPSLFHTCRQMNKNSFTIPEIKQTVRYSTLHQQCSMHITKVKSCELKSLDFKNLSFKIAGNLIQKTFLA